MIKHLYNLLNITNWDGKLGKTIYSNKILMFIYGEVMEFLMCVGWCGYKKWSYNKFVHDKCKLNNC
jgi:hypothetical protein